MWAEGKVEAMDAVRLLYPNCCIVADWSKYKIKMKLFKNCPKVAV